MSFSLFWVTRFELPTWLEQLEMVLSNDDNAFNYGNTIHYNPSDLSSWAHTMLSDLTFYPDLDPTRISSDDDCTSTSSSKRIRLGDSACTESATRPVVLFSDSQETGVRLVQALAFQNAWKALCEAKGEYEATSLVIHANETYTIQPQLFLGLCVSRNLHIQIDGKIEAPKVIKEWGDIENKYWLCFKNVSGLVLNGSGLLHPHGEIWWYSVDHSLRPREDAVKVSNVTFKNFKGTCANAIAIKLDCDEILVTLSPLISSVVVMKNMNLPQGHTKSSIFGSHTAAKPRVPPKPPTPFSQPRTPAKPLVLYAKPPTPNAKPRALSPPPYLINAFCDAPIIFTISKLL
ncbi:unnamed protein product [Arabis nemorensis]|uniref:Transcriptional factor DELLA N-terminal domain-containing protein n=1 Tax=Arabis nemorensis TaxID=586526 RepID=A0A565CMM8_9BRAS|nr:unnamed protein product [Arabis nemorensis]